MTGTPDFFLNVLRAAETREELGLCWKVFAKCSQAFPDPKGGQWAKVKTAFADRARELGLEWKGGQ
jgi:hypothetical protein